MQESRGARGPGDGSPSPWWAPARLGRLGLAGRLVAAVTLLFLVFSVGLGAWVSVAVRRIYLAEATARATAMTQAAGAYLGAEWRRCTFAVSNPVVQRRFAPLLAGSNVDAVTRAMRELRDSSRATFLHAYDLQGTYVTSSQETEASAEPPAVAAFVAALRRAPPGVTYVLVPDEVLRFEGLPADRVPRPVLAAAALLPLKDDFGDSVGTFLWVRLLSGDRKLVEEVAAALGGQVAFAVDGRAVATTVSDRGGSPAVGHPIPGSEDASSLITVAGETLQGHTHRLGAAGPGPAIRLWTAIPVTALLQKARFLGLGLLLACFAAAGAFGVLVTLLTRRSLGHVGPLVAHMDEVSEGRLRRMPLPSQEDEVGRLARGLDRTVESLRRLIGQIKTSFGQVAAVGGQLVGTAEALSLGSRKESDALSSLAATSDALATVVSEVTAEAAAASGSAKGNLATLRRSIESVQSLTRDAGRVLESADKTQEAMAGMALGQGQVSASTAGLVERLTDSAVAVQEIDLAIGEVRDLTDNARTVARQLAQEASDHGRGAMGRAADEMARTSELVTSLVATVRSLGQRSEEIGDIVGIISSVASQSKLLALNASILAAQAGEHGRAFAVVADNMRALSESTGSSAHKVVNLIQNMQEESTRAVQESARGLEALRRSDEELANLVAVLGSIIDGADETSRLVDRIAALTDGQGTASSRVAATLHMVAATSQQVSAAMFDQSQAGRCIAELAEDTRRRATEMKRLADEQSQGLPTLIRNLEDAVLGADRLLASAGATDRSSRVLADAVAVIRRVVEENRERASTLHGSVGRLQVEADRVRENLAAFTLD